MTRAKWNINQEQTLIYALLDEARAGRMSDGGFKKVTWEKIRGILNIRYGTIYDLGQVKSKFSTMKLDYRTFTRLKLNSGFGWDSQKEIVTAPDDVWDSYIQEHPDAANFRHKTLPFFKELDELCYKTTANGEFAFPPPSLPTMQPGSPPNPQFDDGISTRLSSTPPNLTTLVPDSTPVPIPQLASIESTRGNAKHGMVEDEDIQHSSNSRATKKSRKPPKSTADVLAIALGDINASNTQALKEMRNSVTPSRLAIKKIKKEYAEKFSTVEMVRAAKIFTSKEKAEIFLELDGEFQDKWLEDELENAKK